MKQIGIFYLQD